MLLETLLEKLARMVAAGSRPAACAQSLCGTRRRGGPLLAERLAAA